MTNIKKDLLKYPLRKGRRLPLVTVAAFQLAASRKGAAIFVQKNKPRPRTFLNAI